MPLKQRMPPQNPALPLSCPLTDPPSLKANTALLGSGFDSSGRDTSKPRTGCPTDTGEDPKKPLTTSAQERHLKSMTYLLKYTKVASILTRIWKVKSVPQEP